MEGPILPQNMPGYVGLRVHRVPAGSIDAISAFATDVDDQYCAPILSSNFIKESHGHSHCLVDVPIRFNQAPNTLTTAGKVLFGNEIAQVVRTASSFSCAIHGFDSGHFFSTMASHNMPFDVVIAADIRPSGRALFKQFSK